MEWLKELLTKYGVEDELVQKVVQGEKEAPYLPKYRFDELGRRLDALTREKQAQEQELEALRGELQGQAGQKEELEALRAEKEKLAGEYEQKLAGTAMELKIENELIRARARNIKAVRALLDFQKLCWQDGEVQGLKEQLQALREENDYLFESGETIDLYRPRAGKTRTDPASMSDEEYFRYLRQGVQQK